MKFMMVLSAVVVMSVIAGGCKAKRGDEGKTVRERVEMITYRTEFRHDGCPSNGFMRVSGQPRVIEAYGINKAIWPHKCSGCGYTNEIYDAVWPKMEQEWRAVK